jgi:hypothetical protein
MTLAIDDRADVQKGRDVLRGGEQRDDCSAGRVAYG